jgi:WD40 repeat protein
MFAGLHTLRASLVAIGSASADNTVKIWDARTGRLLRTLEGHTGWV